MEKQLEMLKKALEMGATEIRIGFFGSGDREKAKEQIQPFVELTGQPYSEGEGEIAGWFRATEGTVDVTITYLKKEETE